MLQEFDETGGLDPAKIGASDTVPAS